MKRAHRMSLIAMCLCLLAECTWAPKKEPQQFGVLSVRLNKPPPKGKRLTYAVATVHQARHDVNVGFQPVTKDGAAAFVLPMDREYDVRIFCDLNRNQSLDANEPNGLVERLSPSPPTTTSIAPITLAFGVLGPVNANQATFTAPAVRQNNQLAIPAEAKPYLKYMPAWMLDKIHR